MPHSRQILDMNIDRLMKAISSLLKAANVHISALTKLEVTWTILRLIQKVRWHLKWGLHIDTLITTQYTFLLHLLRFYEEDKAYNYLNIIYIHMIHKALYSLEILNDIFSSWTEIHLSCNVQSIISDRYEMLLPQIPARLPLKAITVVVPPVRVLFTYLESDPSMLSVRGQMTPFMATSSACSPVNNFSKERPSKRLQPLRISQSSSVFVVLFLACSCCGHSAS